MNIITILRHAFGRQGMPQPALGSTTPVQQFVNLLLFMAVSDKADRILFGRPSQPCSVEPTESRTLEDQVKAGILTPAQVAEIQETNRQIDEEMASVTPLLEESDPFKTSTVKEIPVWFRIGGKWREGTPLSIRLLSVLIDEFARHADEGICLLEANAPIRKVRYSLGVTEEYYYCVDIKKTET